MIKCLKGQPLHTITPDRGKEFAKHAEVTKALNGVEFYFPQTHQPWKRGTNENTSMDVQRVQANELCFFMIKSSLVHFFLLYFSDPGRKRKFHDIGEFWHFLEKSKQKTERNSIRRKFSLFYFHGIRSDPVPLHILPVHPQPYPDLLWCGLRK